MAAESETPLIAGIFKLLSGISGLVGLWMIFGTTYGMMAGLGLLFTSVPLLWWMGAVIELLARIANNGSVFQKPIITTPKPSTGSGSRRSETKDDDFSSPPKYQL